jgi:uncharacterized protein (TIGR02246 family)
MVHSARKLLSFLVVLVPISAADQKSVEEAVRTANKQWFDAWVRQDADTLDKLEAEDFIFIQDGFMPSGGKSAQLARVRKAAKPLPQTHTVEVEKLVTDGDDVAVMVGYNTIHPSDGKPEGQGGVHGGLGSAKRELARASGPLLLRQAVNGPCTGQAVGSD